MFDTAQRKKLAIGLIFLVVLLTLFLWFNRIPKLDTVEADLVIATGPVAECFQGFCLDNGPGTTLFSRWWSFSQAYLELVALGISVGGERYLPSIGRPRWVSPAIGFKPSGSSRSA